MPLESVGGGAVGAALLAVESQANQAAAAHHRDSGELTLQPSALDLGLIEHGHVEGVVGPGGHLAGEGVGAFAHLATVAAVDHRGADLRRRGPQETLDVRPLGNDHDPADVPGVLIGAPAKYEPSAMRMRWAASEAARC